MKSLDAIFLQVATVAVAFALMTGYRTEAATITWTNTSGGIWSATNNWSPHQLPTNNDSVFITSPGTYNVVVDSSGINVYVTITNLTLGAGGGASGVQTLYVTNVLIGFSVLNSMVVTNGGVFTVGADNTSVGAATMTVANGGVLNVSAFHQSFFIEGTLVVTNGGVVYANNYPYVGAGDTSSSTFSGPVRVENGGLMVANGILVGGFGGSTFEIRHGGVLTGSGNFAVLTNAGTINLTNTSISAGLLNQPGGVVNLAGGASVNGNSFVANYFTNLGTVLASGASPNTINSADFENRQGTVTNFSGVLLMETFPTNLGGTYYAAAGATNQFAAVADGVNYVTAGTPLVLGGPGQYQFTSGDLLLTTNVIPNLALLGGQLKLGAGFQGGAITNLTLSGITLINTLPVTGTLNDTNSSISANLLVASGGTFNANLGTNGSFPAILSVLTVAHGGLVNVSGQLDVYSPLTNSGTINLGNAAVYLVAGGTMDNQSGGLMNILGSLNVTVFGSANYFTNRGTLLQNTPGITNVMSLYTFDNSQGTVTNLSGTLGVGFLGNLTGTYYAAAGATNYFFNGYATPMAAGTPLAFGGPGVFEFASGLFSLPTNTVPGLLLAGGALVLGPSFQGGAITNLTLSGITLTNTLPVKGTFTANYPTELYGNFTVTNGGVFTNYTMVNGAVTVANGGLMVGFGTISASGSLTLANGGTLNVPFYVGLYGPLTNAGTINVVLTPALFVGAPFPPFSEVEIYNDGSANNRGVVVNQATGLINLAGDSTFLLGGNYGSEYLINQGRIIKSAGTNFSGVEFSLMTNSGAITAQSGTIVLFPFVTQSGGNLNVVLASATNYGAFIIDYNGSPPGLNSNTVLAGAFNATLTNGYVPANGAAFNVLSTVLSAKYSGTFSSLGLPSAVSWQSTYGSTNFTLVAGSGQPQFATFNLLGTNLTFNGTGGSPGSNYVVLASTNLTLPLTNWTALTTNTFDGSGQFHYTNNVNPAKPQQFFILKSP